MTRLVINDKISVMIQKSFFKMNYGIDANVKQISKIFLQKTQKFNHFGKK